MDLTSSLFVSLDSDKIHIRLKEFVSPNQFYGIRIGVTTELKEDVFDRFHLIEIPIDRIWPGTSIYDL